MNQYYKKVTSYFNNKADVYDDVDQQLYWVLSDMFFKEVLKREIPKIFKNKKSIRLLDAGAGTGRWTQFFCELFGKKYNISGDLIDISEKMLEVAKHKLTRAKFEKKFNCSVGDIENMPNIPNVNYDIALSFYNVISFVENPSSALKEIYKKLKKGGLHISIVANKYHAYHFSILTGRMKELDAITKKSKNRFNEDMPYIHCFTPEELERLYKKAGFKKAKVIGGLNFMYPGMEETFTHGSTDNIKNKLSDKAIFKKIMQVELDNYVNKDVAGRGNVLMAIAYK